MPTHAFARLSKPVARPCMPLVQDALGVLTLFLLLFVGLSIPGFA